MSGSCKSYVQTPQAEPWLYQTIPDRLYFHSNYSPDKTAFITYSATDQRTVITCKHIYEQSRCFAKGLGHIGIKKGDTVAISFPNSLECLVSSFGVQMVGAVPIHLTCKDKDDIISVLKLTGNCTAIIMETGNVFSDSIFTIIEKLSTENGLATVIAEQVQSLKWLIVKNNNQENSKFLSWIDVMNFGFEQAYDLTLPEIDPDDLAIFFLTSGSTGVPKLVPKTHFQMMMLGQSFINAYGMEIKDVHFNDRLFSWAGGYPTVYIVLGCTRVTSCSQFDKNRTENQKCDLAVQMMKNEQCTVSQLQPTLVLELLTRKNLKLHLRVIATGGVPISHEYSNVVGRFCDEFICAYGLTEIGMLLRKKVAKSEDYFDYCVGQALPGVEVKVADTNGKVLQNNMTGELFIRNVLAFSGYHDNAVKTNEALRRGGWFRTHDIGLINDEGVFVFGRDSDLIFNKGVAISPAFIEDRIKLNPSIDDACVVQIKDENGTPTTCICVVPRERFSLSRNDLKKIFLETKTDTNTCISETPLVFIVLKEFPNTAVGKLFRQGVRREAEHFLKTNNLVN